MKDSPDRVEYVFRNGSPTDNELLLIENNQVTRGKWFYLSSPKKIAIQLPKSSLDEYLILELNEKELALKHVESNDIILFENTKS